MTIDYVVPGQNPDGYYNGRTVVGYDGKEECNFRSIQSFRDRVATDCVPNGTLTADAVFQGSTLLRCDMVNTSYSVDLDFLNGVQNVRVSSNTTGDSPTVNGSAYFPGPETNISDLDAVRALSYQGMMAAFNQVVLGTVEDSKENTSIMRTILAETQELAFIQETLLSNSTARSGQGPGTRGSLNSTLEQLFENYTISLLSDPFFL